MEASGYTLDPSAPVSRLSIADQQKIEIMRALARNARVIVMDEPTSSLTADETERLHGTMKRLRESGKTIIYVSHFLDDILAVCDRITVLRDGQHVKTGPAGGETKASLVSAMLGGGQTETPFPEKRLPTSTQGVPALDVQELSSPAGVHKVSLAIHPGEIVGLLGLVGSGRSEIVRAIVGVDPATEGIVALGGQVYGHRTPALSAERGLVMVPEDRRGQGLVMTMTTRSNMTLPHLKQFSGLLGIMRGRKEKRDVKAQIDYFRITRGDVDGNVINYSGGNQQKVLLGKWLIEKPGVVILDEPSRGVDVGARQRIHEFDHRSGGQRSRGASDLVGNRGSPRARPSRLSGPRRCDRRRGRRQ